MLSFHWQPTHSRGTLFTCGRARSRNPAGGKPAPGGPVPLSRESRVCRTTEEGGRQMRYRESDSPVVPKKAGNAAGGKGARHGSFSVN